jgi:NAD(P)H-flavin reductase
VVGTDPEKGLVWLIFQAVGKSTMQLAEMEPGDALPDLLGPLGHSESPGKVGTVVVIGGGVGTAPVLPRAKEYKALGNRVISIVGARSKELLILKEEMAAASDVIYFCTDDGSFGHHGLVTDLLPQIKAEFGPIA